ncbi:MAG: aldehyde dehydrogenase family protein, partial [Actinomycetia bacterium]|nr:aldehyde dehydrogenase family protein [Actinomycetes bacterium]
MPIATVNPVTGETVKTFEPLGPDGIEERVARAERTFRSYRGTDFASRAALLASAADLLDKEREEIARIMTLEMGKTLAAARAEAAKCAKAMRWYAANGERLLADEHPADADVQDSGAHRALVRYRPLGVVLAVM